MLKIPTKTLMAKRNMRTAPQPLSTASPATLAAPTGERSRLLLSPPLPGQQVAVVLDPVRGEDAPQGLHRLPHEAGHPGDGRRDRRRDRLGLEVLLGPDPDPGDLLPVDRLGPGA